ncbi:MAG: LysM peptidoglycan-binding domain-containing protein, partial [Chloroflexi bacterium]|nr:LysM peptidoglycan-binding domain-containing protein [Chloroflexota bacterium]
METGAERPRRPGGAGVVEGAPGAGGLIALLAAGAALGWALWALAGAPALPDGERLRRALQGTELADAELAAAAAAAAWLLLGYLALSVALRLLALGAARASGGARWSRAGLRLSHLVTIPAVRRLVDSGVGGALLAASWLPLAPGAAPEQYAVHAAVAAAPAAEAAAAASAGSGAAPDAAPALRYTVAPGDDLWGIARRCYGDGTRFVEIFEANEGRVMAFGERFTDPRRVRPGWELSLPRPVPGVSAREDALDYRVRAGDHLWGIAERWLGDGFRWVEIWERNRGREMGGGRRFTDPNVLVPGWVLELPPAVPAPDARPVPAEGAAAFPPREPAVPAAAAGRDPGSPVPAEPGADAGAGAQWPRSPHAALLSAAGVAVLGGAALFVGRRRRSASALPGAAGDAGRVALAAGALQEAFREAGFHGSRPLLLREGGRGLEATVACPPGDAEALAALRYDLARRLGCDVEAAVEGTARVALTLPRRGRSPGLPAPGPDGRAALAVPAGATADEVVYLNLEAAGSVTVRGDAPEQRALLRSWLRTLSTLRPPNELALRADAGAVGLLGEEAGLPHFAGSAGGEPAELADELEELISRRGGRPGRPLVAISAPGGAGAELPEAAMRRGPPAGVYVIRCLPPGGAAGEPSPPGAAVSFGGAGGAGGPAAAGTIALRLGRERPLLLEPVLVRRDASPRWRESAELAAAHAPPDRPPDAASAGPADRPRAEAGAGGRPVPPATDDGAPAGESAAGRPPPAAAPGWWPGAPGRGEGPAPPPPAAGPAAAAPAPPGERDRSAPAAPEPAAIPAPDEGGCADGAAAGAAPLFTVRCLGRFEVRLGDAPITAWPREKSRELLALLATYGGASVPRETVAEAMWPDHPADASLRHMIGNAVAGLRSVLRSVAADEALQPVVTARQRFQLQTALFRVDLDDLDAALRRAGELSGEEALTEYERAASLYAGDLLEHEFFPWVDSYRRDYRRRLLDGAARAGALAERLGDGQRAARFYRVILEREPADEAAACGQMRQLAAAGHVQGARRVYRALTAALQAELDDPGARPSPATTALLDELTAGAGGPPARGPARRAPGPPPPPPPPPRPPRGRPGPGGRAAPRPAAGRRAGSGSPSSGGRPPPARRAPRRSPPRAPPRPARGPAGGARRP